MVFLPTKTFTMTLIERDDVATGTQRISSPCLCSSRRGVLSLKRRFYSPFPPPEVTDVYIHFDVRVLSRIAATPTALHGKRVFRTLPCCPLRSQISRLEYSVPTTTRCFLCGALSPFTRDRVNYSGSSARHTQWTYTRWAQPHNCGSFFGEIPLSLSGAPQEVKT